MFIHPNLFALATTAEIVIFVRQQQHGIAGGMLQAKSSTLNGESEAAGVGKFGVFRFGVNVVIQLQLTSREHDDVLRSFRMHQDLLRMRDHMFFSKRGQRLLVGLPERMRLRQRQDQVGFQRPVR